MSSIDTSAVDVDASSGSSWDGSDSELEVEVTHVVQQQKEEEEVEELGLELDESHKSSKTSPLPTKPAEVCRIKDYCQRKVWCTAVPAVFPLCV